MPKTKEQKQQEALQRASVNFYRNTLAEFLKTMPGGAYFARAGFQEYDLRQCFNRMQEVLEEAKKFGIKLPLRGIIGLERYPAHEVLDLHLTRLWLGEMADLYVKGITKHDLGAEHDIKNLLNDSGKSREEGQFGSIGAEVKYLKDRIFAYRKNIEQRGKRR